MASLVQDKNGNYLVAFRWGGKQFTRALDTKDPSVAGAGVARVEETVMRLKRGWAAMPADAEPGIFIVSAGTLTAKPAVDEMAMTAVAAPPLSLHRMFDLYTAALPAGKKESNTLLTERIHRDHLTKILGEDTAVKAVTLGEAQRYAARRSCDTWRGRTISADTVWKELKTLRYVWSWALTLGHVASGCPWQLKDLQLGKDHTREPFRTTAEIGRRIARGGLNDVERSRQWESLYLTGREVEELLNYVRDNATAEFVYPMICLCALTGARRSELCRSRIDDLDFDNRTVHLRERKRVQSKRETTRIIDMHARLRDVLRAWVDAHPGGQHTLAQGDGSPVSVSLATEHFRRTLAGSERWRVIPGFHTLRHCFASVLACRGVDQRIIDAFMGHQTPEMRARYQHLFPTALRRAIDELLA